MAVTAKREQQPATITLEMDERTAEKLCALVGGIRGYDEDFSDIFAELNVSLPTRELAFSDLFAIRDAGSGAGPGVFHK